MLKKNRKSGVAGLRVLLCAAVLGVSALPAFSEVAASYETGGRQVFSLQVPDHWVLSSGGFEARQAPEDLGRVPRVLGLRPESDRRVWVGFLVPDGVRDLAGAEQYVRHLDLRLVESPEIAPAEAVIVGGRSARSYTGTGTRDGKPVSFSILLIDLPGSQVAIGVIAGENGARGLYRDQINALVRSFRPL